MRLFVRPVEGDPTATDVLRALERRARSRGLPPPAALTGDWFGGSTVLVPSVRVHPVESAEAFDVLDSQPEVTPDPATPEEAVGGGWIGYLGYELTDPAGVRHPGKRRLPAAAWGWTDHVLRRDPRGQWWFEAITEHEPAPLATELGALVAEAAGHHSEGGTGPGGVLAPDAEQHRKSVRRCVEDIAAGEIFQANVCSRFAVPFDGSPLELFATGSARFGPARAAYVAGDWGAVASLSPELFLARHGEVVRSSPIKGTTPRRGPQDDHNADVLRGSRKDIAENVMIVDMARNDLGRVARTGTVTTPKLLRVEPHPGVWHLVSEVRAELPPDVGDAELLRATFPPASVTGAPKVRALEIISELESDPREVYCGAVGMSSPVRGTELNVAIRTLEYAAGEVAFGVGGGITADSDAEAEWQECLTKAAPLLSLLERAGQ
ncbi:aminodeoxychorismate synthase, component I [Actinopolyspora erythraea]|uniref:Aminodeoxychorismate synthase n=1 Tax=Actinopolyspora erythraea TaxID=414996 RepID=A0A099D2L6_9ACTN|nr:aminodeoxychorismate synthase component I [Actinopolyspora erythraea]ASU77572.1 aminodeoxychorismate synthase, component I [Actinopolyspora erythraea]KGI80433.1 aminodeoxychorismate synthase [Actinopolyspora erythraea]